MIKSFKHKGLEKFYKTGTKKGIQAAHVTKLRMQLAALLLIVLRIWISLVTSCIS
ncbi:type II toxin-antitoxin system RelE/ParE family toxin [Candidatus Thalassolituus haligoni]